MTAGGRKLCPRDAYTHAPRPTSTLTPARGLTEVLVEAWKRMIPFPALPEFIRSSSASVRLRCACVESSEDLMTLLSVELSDSFGLEVRPVYVDAIPVHEPGGMADVDGLPAELRYADLVVTTPFHAGAVRATAGALGKPVIVATMNPDITLDVERHLRKGGLSFVVADPRSGEQLRATYAGTHPDRLRIVLADDAEAVARLVPSEPVLLTEAARRRLRDVGPWPLVPHSPWISVESARDLAGLVIRLNLEGKTP